MSVGRSNGQNGGNYYSNLTRPVEIDCNFVVDSTNGNGLGVRSIKSNGYIESVFMNTNPAATTTTAVFASGSSTVQVASLTNLVVGMVVTDSTTGGNITGGTTITGIFVPTKTLTLSAVTAGASAAAPGDTLSFAMTAALAGNPNPIAGTVGIKFKSNYARYINGYSNFITPVTSPTTTSLTTGHAYVITVLGNTTLNQWQAAGFPPGFTPAVGAGFICTSTASIGGTGKVGLPGILVEGPIAVVGDPNLMLQNSAIGANAGAYLTFQFFAPTNTTTTTLVQTAPADGSIVAMTFKFDVSSVNIDGL